MRENHREPEVPEEEVPVVECLDVPARITSKGTCTTPFCEKWHPPVCLFYNACSTSPRVVADFGEKCSYVHRQVDEQPRKRSQKNGDKSAVAMLKKHELYDRTVKPVVCRDTSRAPRTCCVQLIKYTTIGLRLSRYGAAEVFISFTDELRDAETNPMWSIH